MHHDMVRWLLRGFFFSLGVLVLGIALAVVQGGQAQDGNNPNTVLPAASSPAQQGSDDPLQRGPQPAPEILLGEDNTAAMPGEAAAPEARTDHPLGVMGGLAVEGEMLSNTEAQSMAGGGDEAAQPALQEPINRIPAAPRYTSPLVISAADFRSDGLAPEGYMFWFSTGAIYGEGVSQTCLMAPAYLPNGATVTDMFISAYDNNASYDVNVSLWRVDNYAGTGAQVMASIITSAASTAIQTPGTSSITYPEVSYPTHSYFVTTCLSQNDVRLYSVRIYYTE